MHIYKLADGTIGQCDNFMKLPTIPRGHHWYDNDDTYIEMPYKLESVDPNTNYIFGCEESEFMKRQYK